MRQQNAEHIGQHAQALSAGLDDLKRFPPPDAALQTVHYVDKARAALIHLLRVASVRQEVLQSLADIADFSYAWAIVKDQAGRLHALVSRWTPYHP